jgi:predicted alpha/beta-fold hydrolase
MNWSLSPHVQTIIPQLTRKPARLTYARERINTADGDFLDLDWALAGESNYKLTENQDLKGAQRARRLVILIHGLESSSNDLVIKHLALKLTLTGIDALALNLRSCSGELNLKVNSYHSGQTKDLRAVVSHVNQHHKYESISFIGSSLGANLLLKYLGEAPARLPANLGKACAISAPIDLASSARKLALPQTRFYMNHMLVRLKQKLKDKHRAGFKEINLKHLKDTNSFLEYDRYYTAPLNGFKDEYDYWQQASAKPHLINIKIPTLYVSSLDDPFLGKDCFPDSINPNIELKILKTGGHLGFWKLNGFKMDFFVENWVIDFLLDK